MVEYTFHPLADLFPRMSSSELSELAADIKTNGLNESIWLYKGMILDGRHRYLASGDAGVDPIFRDFTGDDDAALKFVVSANLNRRHLNDGQRASVAAKIANLRHGGDRSKTELQTGRPDGPLIEAGVRSGVSIETAAKILNVSKTSVKRAKKVHREAVPELASAMDRGDVKPATAVALVEAAPDVQKTAADGGQAVAEAEVRKLRASSPRRGIELVNKALAFLNEINVRDELIGDAMSIVQAWIRQARQRSGVDPAKPDSRRATSLRIQDLQASVDEMYKYTRKGFASVSYVKIQDDAQTVKDAVYEIFPKEPAPAVITGDPKSVPFNADQAMKESLDRLVEASRKPAPPEQSRSRDFVKIATEETLKHFKDIDAEKRRQAAKEQHVASMKPRIRNSA